MMFLNTLRKISVVFFILLFSLLSVNTFITSFLGSNVYASSVNTYTINCDNLVKAIYNQYNDALMTGNGKFANASIKVSDLNGSSSITVPIYEYYSHGGSWGSNSHRVDSKHLKYTNKPSCSNFTVQSKSAITSFIYLFQNAGILSGSAHIIVNYTLGQGSYKPILACGNNSNTPSCLSCLQKNTGGQYNYVYTDFGCVNATPSGVINFLYAFLLVIAFMIDLVIFIISGYLIMSSGGDPDKINRGKTLFKNAIIGLLVIIFAMVILQLIGSIFGISGL